jgi:hypothetical protein
VTLWQKHEDEDDDEDEDDFQVSVDEILTAAKLNVFV